MPTYRQMQSIRDLLKVKLNHEQSLQISKMLADYLNRHQTDTDSYDQAKFSDLTNLYLYEHGLVRNKGLKDYLLSDFLANNRFLVSQKKVPYDLFDHSILDLEIKDGIFINEEINSYFDIYKEFVALNLLSMTNPQIPLQVIQLMNIKFDRRFMRILSYYSAIYCLHLIVEKEKNQAINEQLDYKLNYMFELYNDFTTEQPAWYK